MSLPQLIGLTCVRCKKGIASLLDAGFCGECGNPIHHSCAATSPEPAADRCPRCGGDPDSDLAKEVRRERGTAQQAKTQAAVSHGVMVYPVNEVCPKCGKSEFTRQRPQGWVSFAWDRVCKDCGTVYSPPTPLWAAIVFIVVGVLLFGAGAISVIGLMMSGSPCAAPGGIFWAFLGVIGLLAIIHGVRSLARPGKV
jgi:hypothetical protein